MTLQEIEEYFINRSNEIIGLSLRGDPWIFLCGSAMIDYLTNMTTNGKSTRTTYITFIESYFGSVDSLYKDFKFQNGIQDLPKQMYLILRCGIVHKFSFVPSAKEITNGARERSILLGHEFNGATHFQACTNNGMDSVVLTAEQFSKDIKEVVELIFKHAASDINLENNIISYVSDFPPIQGNFTI